MRSTKMKHLRVALFTVLAAMAAKFGVNLKSEVQDKTTLARALVQSGFFDQSNAEAYVNTLDSKTAAEILNKLNSKNGELFAGPVEWSHATSRKSD